MDERVTTSRRARHIPLGGLLVATGLFVLAHTVVATRVSVRTLGGALVLAGVVLLVAALLRFGRHDAWFSAVTGALSSSLGIGIVGHPGAAAAGLTLVVAVVFVAGGTLRLFAIGDDRRARAVYVATGLLSIAFGVFVLSDLSASSTTLLGRMLGVQIALDGVTLLLVGRLRAGLRDPRRRRARRASTGHDPAPTADATSSPYAAH